MKKLLPFLFIIFISCDDGWQQQLDNKDLQIKILTIEKTQLKKSFDSLNTDYQKYVRDKSDFIDQMIIEHNKCVHSSPIN